VDSDLGDGVLIGGSGNDEFVVAFGNGGGVTEIIDEGGDNDVLILQGVSSEDISTFFTISADGTTPGVAIGFFDGEAFDDVFFANNTIETIIFESADGEVETLTADEVFGDNVLDDFFGDDFGFGLDVLI